MNEWHEDPTTHLFLHTFVRYEHEMSFLRDGGHVSMCMHTDLHHPLFKVQ